MIEHHGGFHSVSNRLNRTPQIQRSNHWRLIWELPRFLQPNFTASFFWKGMITPPKFNSEFAPEKWCLEADPFLLGPGIFSVAFAVKLPGSMEHTFGTHPEQPLPTGYKGIPFIIGYGDCLGCALGMCCNFLGERAWFWEKGYQLESLIIWVNNHHHSGNGWVSGQMEKYVTNLRFSLRISGNFPY